MAAIEAELAIESDRRLSEDPGAGSSVWPARCMDEEGMAEVDVACLAGGERDVAIGYRQWREKAHHAVRTERRQSLGHQAVGAHEYAGWCVVGPYVGEQHQQQQTSTARPGVDPPGGGLGRVGPLEASIDVPAGVARVIERREPNDEEPEVVTWLPVLPLEQIADGLGQSLRTRGIADRLASCDASNHRSWPRCLGRHAELLTYEFSARSGGVGRERTCDAEKAMVDELGDLSSGEHPRSVAGT